MEPQWPYIVMFSYVEIAASKEQIFFLSRIRLKSGIYIFKGDKK